ncbi:hypothetical protein R6Q57_022721 [Mikania cordata]
MKKKDTWMKSGTELNQGEATTKDAMKIEKPDFESIISKYVSGDALVLDGLYGNSYSTT